MADTLSDAVIRLKLDTKQARKDANALRIPGPGGGGGAVRPTPGKGGGRVVLPAGGGGSLPGGGGAPSGGGGIIPDPSRPLGPAPGPQPVAPPVQPAPPGQARIDDAPIPGVSHEQGLIDGSGRSQSAARRTRKRLRRVESTSAINSLASSIASIPFAEVVGVGIGASVLTDQFGPGIAGGLAQSVRDNVGGATGETIALALEKIEGAVDLNSTAISEVRSVLGGLSAVRESVGAEAIAGELANPGSGIDVGELAEIGAARFKVQRALTQLQRRGEYLKREAMGKAIGGGTLDALFKMSMAK